MDSERLAKQIEFNLLPSDQTQEIMDLWQEFEKMETPEACFAASLDRLQPLLLNYHSNGHTWKKSGITNERVLQRNKVLEINVPLLWDYVNELINDSILRGYLEK